MGKGMQGLRDWSQCHNNMCVFVLFERCKLGGVASRILKGRGLIVHKYCGHTLIVIVGAVFSPMDYNSPT